MAEISLVARLGADPEVMHFESGKNVTKLRLGDCDSFGDRPTNWFEAEAWAKQGELISKCRKGDKLIVWGDIRTEEWNDSATGKKRSKQKIGIRKFQYGSPKAVDTQSTQSGGPNARWNDAPPAPTTDDIPF